MKTTKLFWVAVLGLAAFGLGACSTILDVEFPGTIPVEQIDDPALAPVLARSVMSDFECAYSNYAIVSASQSDEYETSNQNVPLANWGERSITANENAYVIGTCDALGIHLTLHTARFQSEDIFNRISAWTDAQVTGRASLMSQVKAYGGYAYELMGETFCEVSFDAGPAQPRAAALTLAEQRFSDAITLAQQGNNTDMLNLARVGRARSRLMQTKFAEAAADAQLIAAGYVRNGDRGAEATRRWNDVFYYANTLGAYTVAFDLRTIVDPRLQVANTGRPAFIPTIPLWATNKYAALTSPIRLASYREAQLILAESLAEQNQIPQALTILNTRRAELGLTPLTATTKDEAITAVLGERRMELAFEGGHRLADLLRKSLPWKGANGSTVNANPITGRPYGTTTCWPHPTREVAGA